MSPDAATLVGLLRSTAEADILNFIHSNNSQQEIDEHVLRIYGLEAICTLCIERGVPTRQLIDEINQDRVRNRLLPVFVQELRGSEMHTCWTVCKLCAGTVEANNNDKANIDEVDMEWEDVPIEAHPTSQESDNAAQQAPQGYFDDGNIVASAGPESKTEPLEQMKQGQFLTQRRLLSLPQTESIPANQTNQDVGDGPQSTRARKDRFRIQKKRPRPTKVRNTVPSSIVTRSMARRSRYELRQRRGAVAGPLILRENDVSERLQGLRLS